jgi:hypothetical protein
MKTITGKVVAVGVSLTPPRRRFAEVEVDGKRSTKEELQERLERDREFSLYLDLRGMKP